MLLAREYATDSALPAMTVRLRELENTSRLPVTDHAELAALRRRLENEVTLAARQVLSDQNAQSWMAPCWRELAQRAAAWTRYVRLMRRTRSPVERSFFETEALRGGWSVRQLERQIGSQFYTRTLMSTDKRAMLERGAVAQLGDMIRPEEAIKDPYVLEFLDLKDEVIARYALDGLPNKVGCLGISHCTSGRNVAC